MRKILFLFAALVSAVLLVGCSYSATVYLKDYLDDSLSEDAMPAIRAALDDCVRLKASKLGLPGDTHRIKPAKADEEYQYISNNDPSMKRIAFQMKGMKDVAPNDLTHPQFGEALAKAAKAGVNILAFDCLVTSDSLIINNPIPFRFQ